MGCGHGVAPVVQALDLRQRFEQPPNLGGEDVVVTGTWPEGDPDAAFRETESVVGAVSE
jgi:hypothetical protein